MAFDMDYNRRHPKYYQDDFRNFPNVDNKDTQNPVTINNRGTSANVQYNNINIHIHLPESYNKEAIRETMKQLGENLGGNGGEGSEKKSKIFNFWRDNR